MIRNNLKFLVIIFLFSGFTVYCATNIKVRNKIDEFSYSEQYKKAIKVSVIIFLFFGFILSCTTSNGIGNKVGKFLSSKRYKKAVVLVKKLYYGNKELENDTFELRSQVRNKITEDNGLNSDYQKPGNKSGLQLAQLNSDLKGKFNDLQKK